MDEQTQRELRQLVDLRAQSSWWQRWALTAAIIAKLDYRLPKF